MASGGEQLRLEWKPARKLFSVAELNARIRGLFESELGEIWVSGEVSGVRAAPSGHLYFTLKDRESQLKCACFRSSVRYLRFKPQDGIDVLARGRLDVYDARGEYQLLVDSIEPQGYGALQLAFEQLKQKLAAEGLFAAERKRPLPKYPRRIAIVTSPVGAAIQDMLQIMARRFPGLHIRVFPCLVQGEGSVESVCQGIQHFAGGSWAQVLIVARGGGSIEDLWTFNEEAVARAIAGSGIPVISAIGHETDFTISDFVADLRAPTPSAAAELVICTRDQLLEQLSVHGRHLEQAMRYKLQAANVLLHQRGIERAAGLLERSLGRRHQVLDEQERQLREPLLRLLRARRQVWAFRDARLHRLDLRVRLADAHRRLDSADAMLRRSMDAAITRAIQRLHPLTAQVRELSPVKILDRGYAIVSNEDGRVLKDAGETRRGERLKVRLARGGLEARVELLSVNTEVTKS